MQYPEVTLSLRERRRRETARDIQRAAIGLALDQGLDRVTTEMIARAAGVSPRTFFNFFPNKEAAIIGEAPELPAAAVAAFRTGTGPLMADLCQLFCSHAELIEQDPEVVLAVAQLAREYLKVHLLFDAAMAELRADLVALVEERVSASPETIGLLVDIALVGGRRAVDLWAEGQCDSLPAAVARVWDGLSAAGALISAG
ncbi:TetR/AcrR family transcriptional regulator [Pseudodonghicola flavimaris]|uniref:TetR/AcrR family transcriptional regulator n=1 Tax=Pseudodonghicola flavimaris TaxID=3050036 RepID=A0ABT7F3S4_9RHOB|nr:TetR/AcrR family transcriptional regulator [Pseudodonghicola flavimaris]MDK3019256.1 TetR/AcrR family transcriptional regulator [Pseudodonghicola flavimaris]